MPAFIDFSGFTFGKWKAVEYAGSSRWWCVCSECGERKSVIAWNLKSGHSSRCNACRKREEKKHGHSITGKVTTTYRCWQLMWKRCTNQNCEDYKDYGGRGIEVCDQWRDYRVFLSDMGEKPAGLVIDRKDNNGNYTPSNCHWVTQKVNASNKRNTRFVTYDGKRMTLTAVEQITGRCNGALFQILKRFGWPDIDLKILPHPIPRNFLKKFQST